MSEENGTATQTKDPLLSKVYTQLNEEKLVKDPTAAQLSKIKTLDEIGEEMAKASGAEEVFKTLEENLEELPDSLVSRYLLGAVALQKDGPGEAHHLRSLLDDFRKAAKWQLVDHIADLFLEVDESHRFALRAKVESTERLKGKKELKPYLEKLAAIDRKNPDIIKKYALSIFDEDKDKAITSLKQAGETYARVRDYKSVEEIWNLIVQHDHNDMPWFERIERVLVGNREKIRAAALFTALVEPYKAEENWNAMIAVLKKILEYEPQSTRSRSEIVRAYRAKYEDHSLLDDFLKMSDLTNNKKPVGPCIANFERNIVFDNENYVYHRTRGVGKIKTITSEHLIIDFRDNPDQRMSIQMAISSLQPLEPDHIWVKFHENPDEVKEVFTEDLTLFFEMLLSSFDHRMVLAEIKSEVVDRFVKAEEWSKWWSRARTRLKKDPRFGFNPRKKDELLLRETPITLAEELTMKFQSTGDWNKKLDMAVETLKDPDTESAAEMCAQFYHEQESKSKDKLKRLHCFFFLNLASQALGDEDMPRVLKWSEVQEILRKEKPEALVKFCADTPNVEFKKEIISALMKTRDDYPALLADILFELPIKLHHRFIISELNRRGEHDTLREFLKRAFSRFREYPEVCLWAARSILTGQWTYDWIETNSEEIFLLIFRLLKPISRLETRGTRLKNQALETLFGTTNITLDSVRDYDTLITVLQSADLGKIRRMTALFRETSGIPDAHKENFLSLVQEIRPDYNQALAEYENSDEAEEETPETDLLPAEGEILVSAAGLETRKAHLDKLINVDMPANSRDIGEAQEKGDLRENAEYKAAMEKQQQLQAEITRVDAEVKKALIIDPTKIRTDVVTVGTRVFVKNADGSDQTFSILGSWDADADNNIISYGSPLAKALIGKKPGEEARQGDKVMKVERIENALVP